MALSKLIGGSRIKPIRRTPLCLEWLEDRLTPTTSFLGVAAGDVTSSDAILWTRTQDSAAIPNPTTGYVPGIAVSLDALVSTDPALSSGVAFSGTTDPTHDYTIHLDAIGLQSGTTYYYRFVTTDGTGTMSQEGTFKTAPAPTADVGVHLGFTGDADGLMRPYDATSNVTAPGVPSFAQQNFDYFVWLGDTIYETASGSTSAGNISPAVPSSSVPSNLTDGGLTAMQQAYFAKYQQQLVPVNTGSYPGLGDTSGLQGFFDSTGHYTLLDNHELGNKQLINGGAPEGLNGIGVDATNPANDVNTSGTYINQSAAFQALQQAYYDYQPLRSQTVSAPADPRSNGTAQMYFSQQWGANTAFFNLDDRSYRDIRMKTPSGADDTGVRADNPGRTMLGQTELAWIEQGLLAAQANGTTWKFVALSSPIDQIGPIGGSFTINNSGDPNTTQPGFTSSESDGGKSWMGGYRFERNELLKFIADNHIEHVVFMSTDDHQVRINELGYFTQFDQNGTPIQTSYTRVPGAFEIVVGPIGATGPDTITDHSIANIQALAQNFASQQAAMGIDPIGLDPNFPGLINVSREGDPNANANRSAFDFYSPDTFNYASISVDPTGHNLTITIDGLNSYQTNTFPQPNASNPVRQIMQFTITTNGVQAQANSFNLTEGSATVNGPVATFNDPNTTFQPGNLLVSSSLYSGSASTVTVGQPLPGGGIATANGSYPGVWANEAPDASFGVTSPIFLSQLTTSGTQVGSPINVTSALGNTLATSFPSKSELSLNLSADGTAVTFMAYESGANALDVSNSNTPNHIDPTDPVGTYPDNSPPSQRAVAQIDANGNLQVTPVNSYSGNNGRAAILGSTGNYYLVGNAGNGGNISVKGVNSIAGSTTLTITGSGNSTSLLEPGQPISGGNIPAGATVIGIIDATHFAISAAPATSSSSSFTATVTQTGNVLSMLSDDTGVQMIAPGAGGDTTVVGQVNGTFGSTTGYQRGFSVGQTNPITGQPYGPADKTGKDDNFRGLTIFNNTLYVTKGSGSNGVDTVYQVGTAGSLPTSGNAGTTAINVLPGFPTALARGLSSVDSTTTTNGQYNSSFSGTATEFYPFGIWFANATTLYVADEGAPVTTSGAKAVSPSLASLDPNAGLEKWSLVNGVWQLDYTLQAGLNLGVPYSVANGPNGEVYPASFNPATAGLRNLTGRVNADGTVSLYAVTSTSSIATDQGADPNRLVAITDNLSAMTLPASESFTTLRTARFGEVLRGVSFTPNPTLDGYTASIDWGDGTPSTTGTVTLAGSTFAVSGNHTYAEEGNFTVTTSITHDGITTSVQGTAAVADPNITVSSGMSLPDLTEGSATLTNVTLASFTDPGYTAATPEELSDYSALVDWGDGSIGTGVITDNGNGTFTVTGEHTYSGDNIVNAGGESEGTAKIVVSLQHEHLAVQTVTDTVTIDDPNVAVTGAAQFTSTEGNSTGSVLLATFTDPGGPEDLSDYSADINWGDGTGTFIGAGVITLNGTTFEVRGSHTYAEESAANHSASTPYQITVTVHHDGTTPQSATTAAAVADAPLKAVGKDIAGVQGLSTQTVTVATFTDLGGPEDASDYSATINWGGAGTGSTTGTIVPNGDGTFSVQGSFTYAQNGVYSVAVHIVHENGITADTTSTATIKDNIGILLLDKTGKGALNVTGNGSVAVTGSGGAIVVDSSSSQAATASGNAVVSAGEIDAAGTAASGHAAFVGPIENNHPPVSDPLAYLSAPPVPSTVRSTSTMNVTTSTTLFPGLYIGGIKISGSANVVLAPGLYYLQGGGLSVSGQASVTDNGQGVLIYNAPGSTGAGITFSSKGDVNLSGMTAAQLAGLGLTGPQYAGYQGLAIFQDRTSTAAITLSGQGNVNITGTLYAAAATITISGNGHLALAGSASKSFGSHLLAADLTVSGNGGVSVDTSNNNLELL
jgi:phosphodiesterase/alkaline phosphatase D-like protein